VREAKSFDHLTLQLVEQATAGNAVALDEILTTLSRPVYNLALRMLQNHQDAEDAAQESLLRVATNLSTFQGNSRFSTWSWTVATRCILDYQKGRATRASLSADVFSADLADGMTDVSQNDPETNTYLAQVKIGCSRAMLQVLDGDHRLAYVLSEILGLDQAEAAQALGISFATYRKRLSRARAQLQHILQQNCGIYDKANK